jgi:hypothetical protein
MSIVELNAGVSLRQAAALGLIYAISQNNELLWFRHEGRDDGSFRWIDANGTVNLALIATRSHNFQFVLEP